jgi:hypothetical protein
MARPPVGGRLPRINTVVFLEKLRRPHSFALKRSIEAQAAGVLEQHPVTLHFSPRPALLRLGLFAFLLAGIILFAVHYHPFAQLLHPPAGGLSGSRNDTPFELVPGNVNENTTPQKPWGEIRIVNPGHDVKLTKIDVLPLQIEMAASAPLQNPAWITSINGGPEMRHELPPSTEPQYAVYQPLIYLDELKVSDWDVISYYAKVETAAPAEYVSQIYFIEVRPFREDILKATGGNGNGSGHAKDLLEKLNQLVAKQTTVIQQTHQYQQTTYPTEEMRKQDKQKLADAQKALSDASQHLYGEIVADDENAPIGDILDHLAAAQQQMDKAKENLDEDITPVAKQAEQVALSEAVATRKSFYKAISDNPNAFGNDSGQNGEKTPIASTKDSLKALSQVTEMHDRDQATLNKLGALAQQQQRLANSTSDGSGAHAYAAGAETNLKNQVEKLMQDNPDLFRAADTEKGKLNSDMSQAIEKLTGSDSYQGKHFLTQAAGDMSDLQKAVEKNHQLQQLAEAYKLKKVIDQNIQQLGQEKDKPGSLSPQDIKNLSDSAQRSTGTLQELANQPGHDGFGPELGHSLSPENQQALQKALDQLGQSTPGPASQGAASTAQGNLSQVSKAFEQSQPDVTRQMNGQAQGQGPGQRNGQGQGPPGLDLDQAMQELQGLILAQQKAQPPSKEDQSKEEGEILGDLEENLSKDKMPEAEALLAQVKDAEQKKKDLPLNTDELKKLLDKVETVSSEANDPNKPPPPGSEITVIDASKFPASYRDRIRTYYEQLSSHPQ